MRIGPIALRNNFALAPMAGLTDVPFRTLAWRMGAGYMVSEMVSSKAELWETGKSRHRRVPVPGVQPVAIQIAGSDPQTLAESARRHADDGVDVIDINFGCPAKKVCRKAAGSALLSDIALIGQIVERVAKAVDIPVTIKTRLGLTPNDNAGLEAACVAQSAGAQLVVIHGRSRACHFRGDARYERVRVIKERLSIPVLVNGDIDSGPAAERALSVSLADGVMIGRGAVGKPWLFRELLGLRPLGEMEKWHLIEEHAVRTHEFYGESVGVRIMRKHLKAYFATMGVAPADRGVAECLQAIESKGQLDYVRQLADRKSIQRAA
jgi:tRNA-dihydrouridine synthase B